MAEKKYDEEKSWADQVQDLYGQITNRPAFQYDPGSDPLYQAVKDQHVHQGQRAMQDTMGQAAGLTGGYNSSYAQSVGQQQYNEYMTKLSAQIPTLAAQARQAYDNEGQDLYNRYNLAMGMENQEYSRGRDQLADERYNTEWAQQMQAYNDDQAYRQWQMAQAEQDRQDSLNKASQDRAYQMVMQMISTGQTPSAELLAQAGVSADYARSMANYYKQQVALAAGGGGSSGGGSRSSGGSGSGSGGGGGNGYTAADYAAASVLPGAAAGVLGVYSGATQGTQYGSGVDDSTYRGLAQTINTLRQQGNIDRIAELLDQWQSKLSREQAEQLMNWGL